MGYTGKTYKTTCLQHANKALLFLLLCLFLKMTVINMNHPYSFLPLYNEERNISTSWTGVILGAPCLGFIIGPIIVGPVLLTRGSTKILLVVMGLYLGILTVMCSLLEVVKDNMSYQIASLLARTVLGLLGGCYYVTVMSALLAVYPEYLGIATGVGDSIFNGAQACAPFFGALLYNAGGFKAAFLVTGSLYIVSILPTILIPSRAFERKSGMGLPGGKGKEVNDWSGKENSSKKHYEDSFMQDKKPEIKWSKLIYPRLLFPMWHSVTSHILFSFYMPLLSIHARKELHADVVWSGKALMVNAGVHCLFYPMVGLVVDRCRPWKMMIASAFALPTVYICLGPIPPLPYFMPITSCKTQLLVTLAFLGLAVPMATIPALPAMFQIYRSDHKGELPYWVANSLISLYCASFAIGWVVGTCAAGLVAPYVSFAWSTGALGLLYTVQSTACVVFCLNQMKRQWISEHGEREKIVEAEVKTYGTSKIVHMTYYTELNDVD